MLISSLYHTQGIIGYDYQKTDRTPGTEIYYLHSKANRCACPQCRSWNTSIIETGRTRDVRGLSIGLKKRLCGFQLVASSVETVPHQAMSRSHFAQNPE